MHAGELETSVLLAAYPDYVRDGWNTTDHAPPDRRYLSTLAPTPTSASLANHPRQQKEKDWVPLTTSAP
jgi:creatinine amidohydrolase